MAVCIHMNEGTLEECSDQMLFIFLNRSQNTNITYHFLSFFNEVELDLNFSIDLNRRDKKKRLRKKDTPQNVGIEFSKESCL